MLGRRLRQAVFQAFAAALEVTPVSSCVTAENRNGYTGGVTAYKTFFFNEPLVLGSHPLGVCPRPRYSGKWDFLGDDFR